MQIHTSYSIEEIQQGDLIYFNDSPGKSNYDEYWEVYQVDPVNGDILIKLNYLYEDRFNRIKCSDIRQLLPAAKLSQ